jgi:Resolvase, N terminal domain
MAVHQRNTASSLTQEPPLTIARVALYARVSTLNGQDLCAYGVAFVSFRDNLDLSTPSDRLMFQLIGAMAEFERSLIQVWSRHNPPSQGSWRTRVS